MKKTNRIMLISLMSFALGGFLSSPISAMEDHEKHISDSSDKTLNSQQSTDKGYKKNCCPHMKAKKYNHICPSQMKGVVKTTKNIENGIEITMTAKETKKVAKLREIAREHYNSKGKKCQGSPSMVENSVVRIEDIENGVKILITADNPQTIKNIQELAKEKQDNQKEGWEEYIPSKEESGKEVICPVMKKKVKISEKTKAIKYKGKVFYFCCLSCLDEFKKDPDKFYEENK